jgi:small-conductance mechanosensitive channel
MEEEIINAAETAQTVEAIQEVAEEAAQSSTITEAISKAADETFIKQTSSFINTIKGWFSPENIFKLIGGLLIILIFWIIYKVIIRLLKKIPSEKLPQTRFDLLRRIFKYLFYFCIAMYVLSLFGIKLSAIWGAAGITGVAIGFAAQTSLSNIISGLFILTEGSVHTGDTISVDGITGIVDAVTLLSTRVHTYDNQMIRIPNATIINNNLTNNSYHSKRRITINIDVPYGTDLEKALEICVNAANLCPTVLQNPPASAWVDGFKDCGIGLTVAAWFKPKDLIQTKTDVHITLLKELKKQKIEPPFPRMDVSMLKEEKSKPVITKQVAKTKQTVKTKK